MSNKIVRQADQLGSGDTNRTTDPKPRMCIGSCGQPIPSKRLAAQPNARMCVPCLIDAGDVLPIKRFDEPVADGEVHSTMFTQDRRIEKQINHFNKSGVASQADFNAAIGDDPGLGPEPNEIIDGARSLATVFEDDEDNFVDDARLAAIAA